MAETNPPPPPPTAPSDLTLTVLSVANRVGTYRADWINYSGNTHASYARVDLQVRNKATPNAIIVLRTWSPFTGITSATVTATSRWSAASDVEWEFRVVASANGKTADTGWKSIAPLVTPKPNITSVERISETSAWVYFVPPAAGIAAPTSVNVARSVQGQTAGSSSPVNNTALPAALNRIHLPIPAGTASYDAWLRFAGPAGLSLPEKRAVPGWWSTPPSVTNLTATRRASNRTQVDLAWGHAGADGAAALSYLVDYSDDGGQSWRKVATPTGRSTTATLSLVAGRRYGVTAINKAGRSSRVTVDVEAWWKPVPAATDVGIERLPDGRGRIYFTIPTTDARNPLRSIRIYRAPRVGGDFTLVKTLGAADREWVDPATGPMSRYRYQVRPVGDLGEATSYTTVTLDAAWSEPAVPTSTSVERNALSADAFDVSFTIVESESRPVEHVDLLARDPEGRVSVVATMPRAQLDVTDTITHTAGPDRLIEYGVRQRNSMGPSSPIIWLPQQATTPAGPSAFSARRVGADIGLYWVVDSTIADGWDIERTPDGANWFPLANSLTGDDRVFTFAGASYAVAHDFRIRPRRAGAPEAAWVQVERPVPAGGAPLSPLLVEPGFGAADEPLVFEWEHRPVDGSPQSSAVVTWQLWQGSAPVGSLHTVPVAGSVQRLVVTPPTQPWAGMQVRWHVVTYGTGSPTPSPLSTVGVRELAYRPSMALSVPAVVESQQLVGSITPHGEWLSATVQLLDDDGRVVSTQTLAPATGTSFSFPVRDRQAGTVVATVHDGRLSSAEQSAAFEVVLRRPPVPRLSAVAVGREVRLDVHVPAGLRILRRLYAPSWWDRTVPAVSYPEATFSHAAGSLDGLLIRNASDATWRHGISGEAPEAMPTDWFGVAGATLTRAPGSPAATATVAALDASLTQLAESVVVDVPVWPATVDVSVPWAAAAAHVAVLTSSQSAVLAARAGVIYSRDPAPTWGWFDGDTDTGDHPAAIPGTIVPGETFPGDDVHYGWLDGYPYEAVEASSVAEADVAFPQPVRVELLRVTDGDEHTLGDAIDNRGRDPWPRFCAPERYIARAWGDNGAYSDSTVQEVTVHERDLVISYGPGLSLSVTAGPRDMDEAGGTREKESIQWEGARYVDTYESAEVTPETVAVQVRLWKHHSTFAEWMAAHNAGGDVLLREPTGKILRGSLVIGGRKAHHQLSRELSFTVEQTGPRP